jgi:hypothetical protein
VQLVVMLPMILEKFSPRSEKTQRGVFIHQNLGRVYAGAAIGS